MVNTVNNRRSQHIGQTYSADQIIGKTLIARRTVPITRQALIGAPTVYTVQPGGTVGVVYSYVRRGPDIFWMYYDENNQTYYTLHREGWYNVDALQDQGVLTVEEQQEQEQQQSMNPLEKLLAGLGKTGSTVLMIVGVALAIGIINRSNK